MKKYFLIIFICSVIFYTNSCSQSKPDCDFTLESFPKSFPLNNGKEYQLDHLFLEHPTSIRFHQDSFLVIQELNAEYLIKIIDLKNNSTQRLIRSGRGPGEMLTPWGIQFIENDLYVFCGQLRKVIVLRTDIYRKFQIVEEFKLDEKQTWGFYPLKKNLMVCLSGIGDSSRITFLDGTGKIVKKSGSFPPFKTSENIKGDNDIFNSFITATPDGNRIVLACGYTDLLELYSFEKGLIKRICGPIGIELSVKMSSLGIGSSVSRDPNYLIYSKVIANDNEFWAGYVGYKFEKGKRSKTSEVFPKVILCFSWNGKPLRKLELNTSIRAFDVDWKRKVLYTVVWDDEDPQIVCFSLNNIL